MKHKGKILEKAVRKSLVPIVTVGKELGFRTGRHMYNLFEKEDLPLELFIRTGKIIGHDFAKDLPEITQFLMIKEPQEAANLNNAYQLKYLELLEKFVELTNQYDQLKNSTTPCPEADKKKSGKRAK